MNRYGAKAKEHWERWLPVRYSQTEDLTEYFTRLGEEISEQVREPSCAIAGDDPEGEEYLLKVGRLNMAKFSAEGQVMREIALLDPEEEEELSVGRGAQIIHIDTQRGIFSPFSGLPVEPENGLDAGDPTLLLVYSGIDDDNYDYCSPRVRRLVPRVDDMNTERLAASLTCPMHCCS